MSDTRTCGWCEKPHPEHISIDWFPGRLYFCSDGCYTELVAYTSRQVREIVTAAADLVACDRQIEPAERETDLIYLVVNAVSELLADPDVSLDDVMNRHYEGGAAKVRTWWDGWS